MVSRWSAGIKWHGHRSSCAPELISTADARVDHKSVRAALGSPGSAPTTTLIEAWQIEGACG
jgi:hypothetical protein